MNGIDLAGEGGLTWIKSRSLGVSHILTDTARGAGNRINSNSNAGNSSSTNFLSSFNDNGFSVGNDNDVNYNNQTFSSFSFRKSPGFFDVVSYSGNGQNYRGVSHNLGCTPGLILIKRYNGAGIDWKCYCNGDGYTTHPSLNNTYATWEAQATSQGYVGGVDKNGLHLRPGYNGGFNSVNSAGQEYVMYLFAGGFVGNALNSTTASSCDFASSKSLQIAESADFGFGTGDYTVEFWWQFRNLTTQTALFDLTESSNNQWQIY